MQYPINRNKDGEVIEKKVSKWYSPKNLIKGIVYSAIIGTAVIYTCLNADKKEDYFKEISENTNFKKIYSNKEIKEMFGPVITKEDSIELENLLKIPFEKK